MADEAFWRRYGPLFRRIHRSYPAFWVELRELAERHQERQRRMEQARYTTNGARVRDWPETRSTGSQVGAPLRNRRETAVQVDRQSTPPRPMLRVPATLRRDRREGESSEEENWDDPPPALPRRDQRREEEEESWDDPLPAAPRPEDRRRSSSEEGDQPAAPRGGPGCWNCGSRAHRYSAYPRPRRAFCYGCGAEGVTLRDCTRCAEGWRRLGLYHPERGHDRRRE